MELATVKAKEILRSVGLRSTTTRVAVLKQLWIQDRPVSHSELVQSLDQVGDQATIYRNLVIFVERKIARIASTAFGVSRYEIIRDGEAAHEVHPHFVCNACGIVSCLPKTIVITNVDTTWRERLHAAQLQFVGICIECR